MAGRKVAQHARVALSSSAWPELIAANHARGSRRQWLNDTRLSAMHIRFLSSQAIGEAGEVWQMSPKFGKSTVTQELWRRRDADSVGIGSTHAIAYRFSTALSLRDEYVGNTGKVLIGRLLEDLDALAGNIAFDWCSDTLDVNGNPPLLVTAAVDKIRLDRPLPINEDVFLSGRVIWTGSSSMLVRMTMRAGRRPGEGEQLLEADFVYVARDRAAGKAAKVHQISPATEEERQLYKEGQLKAEQQKQKRKGLDNRALEEDDMKTIIDMLKHGDVLMELPAVGRNLGGEKVLIQHTKMENTILTKPQDQNTAGNIFGGMLMRSCYELAFATCFAFASRHPVFKEIAEFVFQKPVPTGSLLRMKSRVLYTKEHDCCVEVLVMVIQPDNGTTFRANSIVVIFDTRGELPQVVPATYGEARAHLQAQRKYELRN